MWVSYVQETVTSDFWLRVFLRTKRLPVVWEEMTLQAETPKCRKDRMGDTHFSVWFGWKFFLLLLLSLPYVLWWRWIWKELLLLLSSVYYTVDFRESDWCCYCLWKRCVDIDTEEMKNLLWGSLSNHCNLQEASGPPTAPWQKKQWTRP